MTINDNILCRCAGRFTSNDFFAIIDQEYHAQQTGKTDLHIGAAVIEGIPPKGSYLPCVSTAGRAILAGYHTYVVLYTITIPGILRILN